MTEKSNYGTVVNCIDGTVQMSVIAFLQDVWGVKRVDAITEPAPEKLLAEGKDTSTISRIHQRIRTSFEDQSQKLLAIASHSGCDMNTDSDSEKKRLLRAAVGHLKEEFPQAEVLGIWVGADGVPQCM